VSIFGLIPELPLLRRELTELSNRRRTYVIRFVGAIAVLSVVMVYFSYQISMLSAMGNGNPNRYMGAGGQLFRGIVPMLFVSVQLLMPALICGSITIEKERNTIGTLFVTRLTPMTIVLEKLFSRLVPMFTFLLLTLPILAFVYSLGGVETTMLLGTVWLLFCECLLYASIGLLCSSWFATTATAFIWSYVLTGILAVFSGLLAGEFPIPVPSPFFVWIATFTGFYPGYGGRPQIMPLSALSPAFSSIIPLLIIGAATIPSLMLTGTLVLLARVFLVRRAFISSSSMLLKMFKVVDGFFTRLNDRTTGGMVLVQDYNSLPLFDPVAWRERSKKSLGKARYLFRILVVMEGPVLFICVGTATLTFRSDFDGLHGLLLLVWAIAAMILTMKGATVISTERVRETLDALLSTPLTAKEILTQKVAGMQRLMIVLAVPILSVHFTLLLLSVDLWTVITSASMQVVFSVIWYSVSCVLTTLITMQILAWISVLLGLRSTSQSRSAMTAICLVAAWVLITSFACRPGGIAYEVVRSATESQLPISNWNGAGNTETPEQMRSRTIAAAVCCLLRPDGGVQANEAVLLAAGNASYDKGSLYYAPSHSIASAFSVSVIVLLWQVALFLLIRNLTLRWAPRLLGRHDQQTDNQVPDAPQHQLQSITGSEVMA
jgi:hypothetical protein